MVEGEAVRARDDAELQRIAVHDGAFVHDSSIAIVFEVAPKTALGFRKGEEFSQTRWRFDRE